MLGRLLPLAACAIALAATAPAHAAWPGTPGKVAYLDRDSKEYPLKVWTPKLGQGSEITVRAETFHFQEGTDTTPMTFGFPSAPVWSPDGTRLAFAAKVADTGIGNGVTHTAIFVWNLRTGATQQVTTPPAGKLDPSPEPPREGYAYADYSPAWSPDGKTIAFIRNVQAGEDEPVYANRGGHVWTVSLEAAGAAQKTSITGELFTALSWGGDPEGQTKLVGRRFIEDTDDVRLLAIDPASGATSTVLSGNDAALINDFDVNPDGLGISYVHFGGQAYVKTFGGSAVGLGAGFSGGAELRASPTGNGALHFGLTTIPGVGQRGGMVERRAADPSGDVWPEDPADRWVNGFLNFAGYYAYGTLGRSLWDVQPQRLPIVNIPGFAGSDIRCGAEQLWPPGATGNGERLQQMRLAPDGKSNLNCGNAGPTLDPDDPDGFVSSVFGSAIYQPQEDFIDDIAPGERGWRFSWDWRKAPGESLARLDALIDRALDTELAKDQGLDRVVLYGHSYGGMLIRHYLDQHPERVARVLTAGTPYWGAAKPLFFVAFGVENPLSGLADLDSFLPNEDAKDFARDSAGLHHLFASDKFGPWLRIGPDLQDQAGVRNWFTTVAGGNGALIDQARAWHQARDGFYTAQGTVEVRAVIGTGQLTIGGVDVAPAPEPDGTLHTLIRLVDGDVTVPALSAHQGPVGTHTPFGNPVHVQSVCGVSHMELGGHVKVTEPYTEYLLRGRTPRKTEGACKPSGFAVKIAKLDLSPGTSSLSAGGSRSAYEVSGGPLTLEEAGAAGKLQHIEVPGAPLAVLDDAKPVDVELAGAGERVTVTLVRYDDGVEGATRTYSGVTGPLVLSTTAAGDAALTANGVPVAPDVAPAGPGDPAGPGAPAGPGEPAAERVAPGLALRSAKVKHGRLRLALRIDAAATGKLAVRASAGKRRLSFAVALTGRAKLAVAKKLPAKLRRARKLQLRVAYTGDARFEPTRVTKTVKR